jgi:hypothetical protein
MSQGFPNKVQVSRLLIEPSRERVAQTVNCVAATESRSVPPVREAHLNLPCTDSAAVARPEQGSRAIGQRSDVAGQSST